MALHNVVKHARASRVGVLLEHDLGRVRLIVEDDGCGFDAAAYTAAGAGGRRIGLVGMRERAALVGGSVEIEAAVSRGTAVFATLPLSRPVAGLNVSF